MGKKDPSLQFLGAAETVTGSRTLFRYKDYRFLIDCGLYQGPREIRERNWEPFEEAERIDAVILTHAHIDHSGFLPRIVKQGFKGPIYCSKATQALCKVLLPDSAHLQEEDAGYANKTHHSRHDPAEPLYRTEDADKALALFQPIEDDNWFRLQDGLELRLLRSGHILGSRFVQLRVDLGGTSKLITFSGDIGNGRSNILKDPVCIPESDVLILESTYGDRRQSRLNPQLALQHIISKVIGRGGTVVIPAFAVGRTQEILFHISQLEERGEIPSVPVYLDSPMALEATNIYIDYSSDLKLACSPEGRLEVPISPADFKAVTSADESMMLCMDDSPKVVISAAGMLTGGRVLHHLKTRLPDEKNGIVFVGYQASGTKGLLLKQGFPEIRIHHQKVPVSAEIFVIDGLSAHGDSEDIMHWLQQFERFPKQIYLNHGEENALRSLKYYIQSHFDCEVVIPRYGEKFYL